MLSSSPNLGRILSKRNFVSQSGHVISSLYDAMLDQSEREHLSNHLAVILLIAVILSCGKEISITKKCAIVQDNANFKSRWKTCVMKDMNL